MLVLVATALAASLIVVALLLRYMVYGRPVPTSQPGQSGPRLADLLGFATGPFPLSIVLHLGVLAFLITRVIEPLTPPPPMIQLESDGGGGGNLPDLKVPAIPDAPVIGPAQPELDRPPQIVLP